MPIPSATLDKACALIRYNEGFRAHPYQDGGGVWTIGYGFTRLLNGQPVTADTSPMTVKEANTRLSQEASALAERVMKASNGTLTGGRLAALTSFAWNIGLGTLLKSTLWKLAMQAFYTQAGQQFTKWDKTQDSHGAFVSSPGLLTRRKREQCLWTTGCLPAGVENVA